MEKQNNITEAVEPARVIKVEPFRKLASESFSIKHRDHCFAAGLRAQSYF